MTSMAKHHLQNLIQWHKLGQDLTFCELSHFETGKKKTKNTEKRLD